MLTRTLRALERDGLAARTVYPTIPPRVEYDLTPLGRTLLDPLSALADWAVDHGAEIATARDRHDAHSQGRQDRRPGGSHRAEGSATAAGRVVEAQAI